MYLLFFIFIFVWVSPCILGTSIKGPCQIETDSSSRLLNCTLNGYFEVVQCRSNYCVCVNPKTGHDAAETQTDSINQKPVCGKCHLETATLLSKENVTHFPQCSPNTGNFETKQCVNDNSCFCVNEVTGETVKNASGHLTFKANNELNCQSTIEFSIDSEPISKTNENQFQLENNYEGRPIASSTCGLPKHSGQQCDNSSTSVQWYFDIETFECLAFQYKGCGGNKNRFLSSSDCLRSCKLADAGMCSGMKDSAKDNNGKLIICISQSDEHISCPANYQCTMLAFFGVCCETATQELYRKNYNPICENDKNPEKFYTNGGIPMTLIGKTCSDNFCSQNTKCVNQEIFAHCCPN